MDSASNLDARWQTIEKSLNQIEKDLILTFGNKWEGSAKSLDETVTWLDLQLLSKYRRSQIEGNLKSLIKKQFFCQLPNGNVFLNVVNYPSC